MKRIGLLIVSCIMISCTTNKYYLTSSKSDLDSFRTRPYSNSGTLFLDETHSIKNKDILIPPQHDSVHLIQKAIEYTRSKQLGKLENLLKKETQSQYKYFVYGIYYLYRKDYTNAIKSFQKNQIKDIDYIAELLIIDCKYEISIKGYNETNYNKFLQMYQDYIDKHKLSEEYKEIVKNRIRFIRYNI